MAAHETDSENRRALLGRPFAEWQKFEAWDSVEFDREADAE